MFNFNMKSAETMITWIEKALPSSEITSIGALPENVIIEKLMFENEENATPFIDDLRRVSRQDSIAQDRYLIYQAIDMLPEIKEIIQQINTLQFSNDVWDRARLYFPADFHPAEPYDVFFTLNGWKWGDAMTFSYLHDAQGVHLSDEGKPAIMINLTLVCKTYGDTTKQRLKILQNVLAHETFHALFSDFKKQNWSKHSFSFSEEVAVLMLNEGLAHYIANGHEIAQVYGESKTIQTYEQKAFESLSKNANQIFDETKAIKERRKIVNRGTFGPFWQKYLCISGLFMIYHIENNYGIAEVKNCVRKGEKYFIQVYEKLSRKNKSVPNLPTQKRKLKARAE